MNRKEMMHLLRFGITTLLFHRRDPLVGSIILTDRCNLACRHCAVANRTGLVHPYEQILADMDMLWEKGVRILLLYGGEPFLWSDRGRTVRDLVVEARARGFFQINVVTNGTFPLDLPEADLLMVSLDGDQARHDAIRGPTYDVIRRHIDGAAARNVCLYMAVNGLNHAAVDHVLDLSQSLEQVKACAFNLHTPYPGTEDLSLTHEEKLAVCDRISQAKRDGATVLNLVRAFPALIEHRFEAPCHQCIIAENGRTWPCGRCVEIPGLCAHCGFAFAANFL